MFIIKPIKLFARHPYRVTVHVLSTNQATGIVFYSKHNHLPRQNAKYTLLSDVDNVYDITNLRHYKAGFQKAQARRQLQAPGMCQCNTSHSRKQAKTHG